MEVKTKEFFVSFISIGMSVILALAECFSGVLMQRYEKLNQVKLIFFRLTFFPIFGKSKKFLWDWQKCEEEFSKS